MRQLDSRRKRRLERCAVVLRHGAVQDLLQARIERDERQLFARIGAGNVLNDRAPQRGSDGRGERFGIFRDGRALCQRLGDGAHVAHGHLLGQEVLQHLEHDAEIERLRHEALGELRMRA